MQMQKWIRVTSPDESPNEPQPTEKTGTSSSSGADSTPARNPAVVYFTPPHLAFTHLNHNFEDGSNDMMTSSPSVGSEWETVRVPLGVTISQVQLERVGRNKRANVIVAVDGADHHDKDNGTPYQQEGESSAGGKRRRSAAWKANKCPIS